MCTQTRYSINDNYQYNAYGNIEMSSELQMNYITKNVNSGKGETEKEKETEPVKETLTTLIIGIIPTIEYVKRVGGLFVLFCFLFLINEHPSWVDDPHGVHKNIQHSQLKKKYIFKESGHF